MPMFVFGSQMRGNPWSTPNTPGAIRRRTPVVANSMPGGDSGGNRVDRYNPAYERLEQGSVIESWIPKDLPGLNKMYREIFMRDGVSGPAVGILAHIPWSGFDVVGIDDPTIRKFFEDAAQLFGPNAEDMPALTTDYLMLGRVCVGLLYDEQHGYWTDYVPHDPDFLTISPIGIRGVDPKIDLNLSSGNKQMLSSQDYRDVEARRRLPDHFLRAMQQGKRIPLDPLATLFAARQVNLYDHVGTSILTRVLPAYALEIALINATVTAARRRAGDILHVMVGEEGVWTPNEAELSDIAGLFTQADEDPVGAVVVTRKGVDTNVPRQGGQLWKLSDEFQFLTEYKMRALGISETLLTGEANYNSAEAVSTLFIEQIRQLRAIITQQVYIKRFEVLARAHGFVKRTQAELDHNVRVRRSPVNMEPMSPSDAGSVSLKRYDDLQLRNLSQDEAFRIPRGDLIIPDISWHKKLTPDADMTALDILDRLEEKKMPIPLRMWASRAGFDIDEALGQLDEDTKLRRQVRQYRIAAGIDEDDGMGSDLGVGGGGGGHDGFEPPDTGDSGPPEPPGGADDFGGGGGGEEPSGGGGEPPSAPETGPTVPPPTTAPAASYRPDDGDGPLWMHNRMPSMTRPDAIRVLGQLRSQPARLRSDPVELKRVISAAVDHQPLKREMMCYLAMRSGVARCVMPIDPEAVDVLAAHVAGNDTVSERSRVEELQSLARLTAGTFTGTNSIRERNVNAIRSRNPDVDIRLRAERSIPNVNPQLFSGLRAR